MTARTDPLATRLTAGNITIAITTMTLLTVGLSSVHSDQHQQQRRERDQGIHQALEHEVDETSEVCGGGADERAHQYRQRRWADPDDQRDSSAVDQPAELIAPRPRPCRAGTSSGATAAGPRGVAPGGQTEATTAAAMAATEITTKIASETTPRGVAAREPDHRPEPGVPNSPAREFGAREGRKRHLARIWRGGGLARHERVPRVPAVRVPGDRRHAHVAVHLVEDAEHRLVIDVEGRHLLQDEALNLVDDPGGRSS